MKLWNTKPHLSFTFFVDTMNTPKCVCVCFSSKGRLPPFLCPTESTLSKQPPPPIRWCSTLILYPVKKTNPNIHFFSPHRFLSKREKRRTGSIRGLLWSTHLLLPDQKHPSHPPFFCCQGLPPETSPEAGGAVWHASIGPLFWRHPRTFSFLLSSSGHRSLVCAVVAARIAPGGPVLFSPAHLAIGTRREKPRYFSFHFFGIADLGDTPFAWNWSKIVGPVHCLHVSSYLPSFIPTVLPICPIDQQLG